MNSNQRNAYENKMSILSIIAIEKILKVVVVVEDLRDYMKTIVIFVSLLDLKQILNAAQLSYLQLRFILSLSEIYCDNKSLHIDLNEIVSRNERHLNSYTFSNQDEHYLFTLHNFLAIVFATAQIRSESWEMIIIHSNSSRDDLKILGELRSDVLKLQESNASFVNIFERLIENLLRELNWSNVIVVEDMILITLLHTNFSRDHISHVLHSDLDIYLYELNAEKVNVKMMKIYNVW